MKRKSRTGILAIGTLAFLMGSCGTFKAHSDAASNDEVARLIEKHKDAPIGRYQMLSVDKAIVKLDTATGDTWMLNNSHWQPLTTEPVQEWTRDASGNPVPKPSHCAPTPQDPCTNVWLYKDPDHLREAPPVGTVDGGYRFKGGNANSIENWESAPGVPSTNPFRR
jgi:hypothetical protein